MPTSPPQGGASRALVAILLVIASYDTLTAQEWSNRDIGGPSVAGSARGSAGSWTVTGAGNDIWNTSDQFHFVYQKISGSVDISVRVDAIENVDPWVKAGVMIRDGLAGGARHAFMLVSPGKGLAFQRRTAAGGESVHTSGGNGTAPGWVRLVREGSRFKAYRSANGSSWTLVGEETISMPSAVYVGLAVTSHEPSRTATAIFSNLKLRTPLPAPWTNGDIGGSTPAGSAALISGTFTVRGGGADIWDESDQFHYVYQPVQGNVEIVARLASLAGPHHWSKAGVMIRDSLSANARHAYMLGSTSMGWAFQRRTATGGVSYHSAGPSTGTPGWVKLVREGTLISAFHSVNGSTWTLVDSDTIAMGSTIYVGLAVTSHSKTSLATASFSNVIIREASGSNQAPTVTITSPAHGSTFTSADSITIEASASDPDGTVSRVEFYRGGTLLGLDTSNPYRTTWNNLSAGEHSLTAVAIDDAGQGTTSTAVKIKVTSTSNLPPAVTLTSPVSGTTITAGSNLSIIASASDPDGSVVRVEFYAGSQLLATDSSTPYSWTWSKVPAGAYTLMAVAVDDKGARASSPAVNVTVTSSTTTKSPITLIFAASSDHSTNVTSYAVAIYKAADAVTATPVATKNIGKPTPITGDISVDISTMVHPLPSGLYKAVVTAINPGGSTASQPSANFSN